MKASLPFSRLSQRVCSFMILSLTTFGFLYADCTYEQKLKAEEFEIGVMLIWKTSTENNSLLFEIQKSTNGKDFIRIGSVEGSGNSLSAIPYRFLDVAPKDVKSLYRLCQVDKDGSARLSEVTLLNRQMKSEFTVVQLNVESWKNVFNCTVDVEKAMAIKATVKNALGETLFEFTKHVDAGLNRLEVDITKLAEGPYKIVFTKEREVKIFNILKKAQEPDVERNIAVVQNH